MAKTYDSKCHDLARHFGTGDPHQQLTEAQMDELASDLQDTVESFFNWLTREPPSPDGECFRGGEYAASVQRELAEARKLK